MAFRRNLEAVVGQDHLLELVGQGHTLEDTWRLVIWFTLGHTPYDTWLVIRLTKGHTFKDWFVIRFTIGHAL